MADILDKILDVKADEVTAAKKQRDFFSLRRDVESDSEARQSLRGFEAALRSKIAAGQAATFQLIPQLDQARARDVLSRVPLGRQLSEAGN